VIKQSDADFRVNNKTFAFKKIRKGMGGPCASMLFRMQDSAATDIYMGAFDRLDPRESPISNFTAGMSGKSGSIKGWVVAMKISNTLVLLSIPNDFARFKSRCHFSLAQC